MTPTIAILAALPFATGIAWPAQGSTPAPAFNLSPIADGPCKTGEASLKPHRCPE
jgi:hypothetical protein